MGGLAGIAGAIGGKALDFGFGAAASALSAKMQRGLRRTVYQDQVHSLRQAGLNPLLAVGGAPSQGTPVQVDTGGSVGNLTDKVSARSLAQQELRNSKATEKAINAQEARDRTAAEVNAHTATVQFLEQFNKEADRQLKFKMLEKLGVDIQEALSRIPINKENEQLARENTRKTRADATVSEARIPEAEALMKLFDSEGGEGLKGAQVLLPLFRMLLGSR